MPGGVVGLIVGTLLFLVYLFLSVYISGMLLRPFKGFFKTMDLEVKKEIVGRVGIVRTTKVDASFGEAFVEDGGAGLIVKVRPLRDEEFLKGDRVVLIEHIKSENLYKVISEIEFNK